ncbi:MAG: MYXO-CTERM sorting domain-containing protein [Myxococcota bacterium]
MARGLASLVSYSSLAAALALTPASTASAAPIELVEQRAQFMLFDDVDGSVENANWFARDPFLAGYQAVEEGFLLEHPDDSQFLVVYTTWTLPAGIGAFFQSMANDVEGIGFEHIANEDPIIPAPFFDDTPNSQVQGFLNMNRWTQYLGSDDGGLDDARISLIFGQELGHAWASFVYYNQGMGWETNLLGRANAHWSFYMQTGGSPLQGHEWVDNGDGTFTAIPQDVFLFSDLDLYLMGLLPPEDVEPWFILENPFNCVDSASKSGDCAPPGAFLFEADTYTINATRRDVDVSDVISAEGMRVPAFPDAPDEFDVSFLFIKRPGEELSESELESIDAVIERSIELFVVQTRGLGHVINRTAAEPPPGSDTGGNDDSGGGADETGNAGTDGSAGGEEGPGGASDSAVATTGGSDGTGGNDGAGQDGDGGGCACAADSPSGSGLGPWAAALLLLPGWRRRKTSAAR